MDMLTKKIRDEEGVEHEALNPYAKLIIGILLGTGVLGTNAAQYFGVEKTEVVQIADVEKALETKLMTIEHENRQAELDAAVEDAIDHKTRDTRIEQNEKRIAEVEEDMMVQTQVLYQIREAVTE